MITLSVYFAKQILKNPTMLLTLVYTVLWYYIRMTTNERLFVAKFTIFMQYVWNSSRIFSYLFLSPIVKVIKIYVAEIYFSRLYRLLTFAEMGRTGFKHVTCDRKRPGTEFHSLVPLVPSWTLLLCLRGWCWTINWSNFVPPLHPIQNAQFGAYMKRQGSLRQDLSWTPLLYKPVKNHSDYFLRYLCLVVNFKIRYFLCRCSLLL